MNTQTKQYNNTLIQLFLKINTSITTSEILNATGCFSQYHVTLKEIAPLFIHSAVSSFLQVQEMEQERI